MEENRMELERRFYEVVAKEDREPLYLRLTEHKEEAALTLERVWKLRYDRKDGLFSKQKDVFLEAFFDLLFVENALKSGTGFRRLGKEMQRIAKNLGLYTFEGYQDKKSAALVREYRNATRYFIILGMEDRVYSSGILHVARMEDAKIKKKLARDLHAVTVKVPRTFEVEDLFAPFSKAAEAVYADMFPESGRCFGYVCENKS